MIRYDYPRYVQTALRQVIYLVLKETEEHGLEVGHHFRLSLRTSHPLAHIPAFLREQYPEEMVIVLENQFWDLEVDPDVFSVTLSFGGKRHRLTIPFEAVTAFADPEAQFGLRFDLDPGAADGEAPPEETEPPEPPHPEGGGRVVRMDSFRKK